jgi:RNA recognition motif-containing protein
MNIFVGNLSFSATEQDVKSLFETFGVVASVNIKRKSGKNSRGFGFVTMPDESQAQGAIRALQDKEFMGRPLSVSAQRPKAVKPKKDYKEIKRLRREAKDKPSVAIFTAPVIPEKEDKPRKKFVKEAQKFAQPAGAQAWEKRKGRGTAKPWKKKPGGVNKKFKYAR